jgi:rhamnosyltransferase
MTNSEQIEFPKNPTTSWVIRTKNEERWLSKVLETLFMQSRLDFEVIIVDSGSTDKTLEIVAQYPIRKVIHIKPEEFGYAYALNLGINEVWGNFIGIISAHSLPVSRTWYEEAFKNFKDPLVACVGGQYTSLPDGNYLEKLGDLKYHIYRIGQQSNIYDGIGRDENFVDLTNTNLMIRKSLWQEYYFDETLQESEDVDWVKEMQSRGYKTVFDPKFNVYHSHGGINKPIIEERRQLWEELRKRIDNKIRPSQPYSKLKN